MSTISIGIAIRNARMELGLSQKDLAKKVYEISPKDYVDDDGFVCLDSFKKELNNKTMFISGIERGKNKLPDKLIHIMTEVLQLKAGFLIDHKIAEYREKLTGKSK